MTAPRGRLFVVATPIGNLGDITLRALETLRSVRLIAAEDTRQTQKLLRHYRIAVPLVSYHAHNRVARLPRLLAALQAGDVALVSDAGTPLISDPGRELVLAAAEAGHAVVPIPGPAAPIAALMVSGLDTATFHFLGFLPRRRSQRRGAIAACAGWPGSLVLFEAPHRLAETLEDLQEVLGNRRVAVCGELTKLHEEVYRTTLLEAIARYRSEMPRGEYTLVVEGAGPSGTAGGAALDVAATAPETLTQHFERLSAELGNRKRALARLAQETGQSRKDLYRRLMAGNG